MSKAEEQSARERNVIEAAPITLSIATPIPAEVAVRAGETMGFYDRPANPFRMYASVMLG